MLHTHTTIFALAALAAALSTITPARAQMAAGSAQGLITPGRLALPASAFGRDAMLSNRHIDRPPQQIDGEDALAATTAKNRQGHLYTRLDGSGSLFEEVILPATARTGNDWRYVYYMATAFPTTGAAQAAWRGDTSFLGTYWGHYCARPDLVAVQGRYSTCAVQYDRNFQETLILVAAVIGNVEFTIYAHVYNDKPGSLPQVQADASTVARYAFSAYAHLPAGP